MKIEKAIELLELEAKGSPNINPDDLSSAFRLGLEALKGIKKGREGGAYDFRLPLQGEGQGGHHET